VALPFAITLLLMCDVVAAQDVPLPRPRPPEAASSELPEAVPPNTPTQPEPPSECMAALTSQIAIVTPLPPIAGPGACGSTDLVRLDAIVLADASRVPVKPAATLRCAMATAVANWVRDDISAVVSGLNTTLREIDNFDSYQCRGRNNIVGAQISEHGKANALDVRGFRLADGRMLSLTDRTLAVELRERVKATVCARFTTVLGPGSDWYHEDHIHLDLAQRRNGYRLCQWDVFEPLPSDVPLPPDRPADAPPREEPETPAQPAPVSR
jgi:hypothetical protein